MTKGWRQKDDCCVTEEDEYNHKSRSTFYGKVMMTLMTMTLITMTLMMMTMTLMMKWPKARQGKYPGKQDDHDHPRSPLTLIHQRCIFGKRLLSEIPIEKS